jgi:tetratricopeptide (TPR) repeat protein
MNKNEKLNQGFKHFGNQDYKKAIECFKKAIELDPNFDTAYNALAEAYNKSGRLDDAIIAAKKMVEISPNDPFSHTALSRLYVQKGLIEDAEREMAISHQLAQQQ